MIKKVTSRDVARAAGVSQSMVSLILNNVPGKKINPETRQRVLEAAKALHYIPNVNAQNMKNSTAGAIGLLSSWDAHSFVFPPVVKGIQAACQENDLGMVICTGQHDRSGHPDYISYFLQKRIAALVYISYVGVTSEGVIDDLVKNNIPFVCIIGARDIPGVNCVDVSFLESGYLAGLHLADTGYEHVAYLLPTEIEKMNYAEKERLEGCKKSLQQKNRQLTAVESFIGLSDPEDLWKECSKLLLSHQFDAVVSTTYPCYMVLKTAARMEIAVPETLGVISLDNESYAPYLYPSLTTVDEPLYDIAKSAMSILLRVMDGDASCRKLEIAPRLSIRESTNR